MQANIKYSSMKVASVLEETVVLTANAVSITLPKEIVPLQEPVEQYYFDAPSSRMYKGRVFNNVKVDTIEEDEDGKPCGYMIYHPSDYTMTGQYYLINSEFATYSPELAHEFLESSSVDKDMLLYDLARENPLEVKKMRTPSNKRKVIKNYPPISGDYFLFEISMIISYRYDSTNRQLKQPSPIIIDTFEGIMEDYDLFNGSSQAECFCGKVGPFFVPLRHLKLLLP